MTIRPAQPQDSDSLIELTALAPMQGVIGLRVDRRPDFFGLLRLRGESSVFVAENEAKEIVGCFSVTKQPFVIGKANEQVHYLSDLKVHPDYSGSSLAYRLVRHMHEYLKDIQADLLICTAADGNNAVASFFNGRAGIPSFRKAATFNVLQILPRNCRIDSAVSMSEHEDALGSFYRTFLQRYCMHAADVDLTGCTNLSIVENNRIIAAVSLFDPGTVKQNVVTGFPLNVRVLLAILKGLQPLLRLPALPNKGEALRLLYLRYFGFLAGGRHFLQLISAARQIAFVRNYHFLTIAIDENDLELNTLIKPLSRFNFRSHVFITSLNGNKELVNQLSRQLSFEDYSLV